MPCVLEPDPSGNVDVMAIEGDEPVMAIRSAASPMLLVTQAALGAQELPVEADNRIPLPPLTKGIRILQVIIEGVRRGDDIQLAEVCDDGEHTLATKPVGGAAFGAQPLVIFTVFVGRRRED